MTTHRPGAPPGDDAGQARHLAHNVDDLTKGSDVGILALDPDDPRLIAGADRALCSGGYVFVDALGLVLVSDTFVLEAIANGAPPLPVTPRLIRADGRTLYAFRMPSRRWPA